MDVLQFLHVLGCAPHIEVVKAQLPELRSVMPDCTRTAPFQYLHCERRRAEFGFIDQKMNVLRNDDMTDNHKPVPAPNLFQDFEELVTNRRPSEQWLSPITAEGDEMEVSVTVVAREMGTHQKNITNYILCSGRRKVRGLPALSKNGKGPGTQALGFRSFPLFLRSRYAVAGCSSASFVTVTFTGTETSRCSLM